MIPYTLANGPRTEPHGVAISPCHEKRNLRILYSSSTDDDVDNDNDNDVRVNGRSSVVFRIFGSKVKRLCGIF